MRKLTLVNDIGQKVVVVIDGSEIRYVHDDDMVDALAPIGQRTIRRASTVEPTLDGWVADMEASGGPIFHGPHRKPLIAAEVEWLNANAVPFPS